MATLGSDGQNSAYKGKGRALSPEPTERTPLLPSQVDEAGPSSSFSTNDHEIHSHSRRGLCSTLTLVFLTSLALCIITFLLLALLAYSYAARISKIAPEDILGRALVVRGPDQVNVLNITEDGGIWINVKARVGVDAGAIIGVNTDDDEGTFRDLWKSFGRWGIRQVDIVSVHLSTIEISSSHDSSRFLASVTPSPFEIPVTANPQRDLPWLTNISTSFCITPTTNASALYDFVRQTWKDSALSVEVSVPRATIRGGGLEDNSWRQRLNIERLDIQSLVSIKIPPLPGLPRPGDKTEFPSLSQIMSIKSFSIYSENETVLLDARVSAVNPLPLDATFTLPALPFTILLPNNSKKSSDEMIPIASVHTHPLSFTHPNVSALISGMVLSLPPSASSSLSAFVSRFLALDLNPIGISTPLFPSLHVDTNFPSPQPKPHVLRNVTIQNMKLKATGPGGSFMASGTVYAKIVLPKGMDLTLDVNHILPDVLVYDGPVPDELPPLPRSITTGGNDEPSPELPDPLPERAFAHIRPDDWLESTSVPLGGEDGEGSAFAVTANIADVPLDVLPGRQMEFSNFVSKVIFGSQGALAGLQGSAAVGVYVHGLPFHGEGSDNELHLTGLPFSGSVRITKKNM